jgi:hypothetical protein
MPAARRGRTGSRPLPRPIPATWVCAASAAVAEGWTTEIVAAASALADGSGPGTGGASCTGGSRGAAGIGSAVRSGAVWAGRGGAGGRNRCGRAVSVRGVRPGPGRVPASVTGAALRQTGCLVGAQYKGHSEELDAHRPARVDEPDVAFGVRPADPARPHLAPRLGIEQAQPVHPEFPYSHRQGCTPEHMLGPQDRELQTSVDRRGVGAPLAFWPAEIPRSDDRRGRPGRGEAVQRLQRSEHGWNRTCPS